MTDHQAPLLTDRPALLRNRARSESQAMFLHEEALTEVMDRLSLVNRQFTDPAIVTGHPDLWGDTLAQSQAQKQVQARVISDTDTLDLQPQSHDLIVHAMCLHWANDPVGQMIQCRRALKPDGMFIAVSLGGETLNELRACLGQAETTIRGGLSPRVLPMADLRDLGALLQRAGFALPVADSISLSVEYDGLRALSHDLRKMGEANALASRDRRPTPRALFDTADELYTEHFSGTQKPIKASFELITLTGWAPAKSQQKPLRPGSAQARLADALGTKESPLRN